jgi:NAD(P)-dependent dehydrogenase (short-subunit alcohol dehydrogenase family)
MARRQFQKFAAGTKDIGEMVAFLASDAAKFITGQRITVNSGNTMP